MIEALRLGLGLILLGGFLFGAAYVFRSVMRDAIPQDEIDAEARRLIVDHGKGGDHGRRNDRPSMWEGQER